MIARPIIYKNSVCIYACKDRKQLRFPTGIKADKLNSNGLLGKGIIDYDKKNDTIKEKLKQVQDALDTYPTLSISELSHYLKKGVLPNQEIKPVIKQLSFLECFERFIQDSKEGTRLTTKGTKIEKNTLKNYGSVFTAIKKFNEKYDLTDWSNINDTFYLKFCNFCWNDLKHFDNNTGKCIKTIKSVLNYCYDSGLIPYQINTKKWKVWKEDIDILVLYKDEIRLINNMPLNSDKLDRTRSIFLVGVFTCLRIENLLKLTEKDLQVINGEYYLNIIATKTKSKIKIKLNPIAANIIQKYRNQYSTLLPKISSQKFNENLKELATAFKNYLKELKEKNELTDIIGNDWENDFKRIRTKKGVHIFEYISPDKYISSHVMRRSGITNLLMMGLSQFEVSAISSHSLSSREFTRYIKIASQVVEKKSVDAWTNALT